MKTTVLYVGRGRVILGRMAHPEESGPADPSPRWKTIQRIGFVIAAVGMAAVMLSFVAGVGVRVFGIGMGVVGIGMVVVLAGTLLAFRTRG